MATPIDLITWAKSQVTNPPYTESPAGSNKQKYSGQVGAPNAVPWCDIFVSAGFKAIGMGASEGVHTYTPEHRQSYINRHSLVNDPQPGDIVFYYFGGSAVVDHVGIVIEVHNSLLDRITGNAHIIAIEGNTSSDSTGSQSNGGGVFMRRRSMKLTKGFGRPAYSYQTPTKEQAKVAFNGNVVAIRATSTGNGYRIFFSDGGVFNFGDATDHGNPSAAKPKPIVDADAFDGGYVLVASDGAVYAFGSIGYHGGAN